MSNKHFCILQYILILLKCFYTKIAEILIVQFAIVGRTSRADDCAYKVMFKAYYYII